MTERSRRRSSRTSAYREEESTEDYASAADNDFDDFEGSFDMLGGLDNGSIEEGQTRTRAKKACDSCRRKKCRVRSLLGSASD